MTPTTALVTVAAKNYVPRVRALARSLGRHHPELRLHLVLSDRVEGFFEPATEPYELVDLERLPIAGLDRLCFTLSRKQLAVVAKPYALAELLDRGFDSALFLDPDTFVVGDLGDLLEQVQTHAVITVPHLVEPVGGEEGIARELNILQCGVHNGGLLGVSETSSARAFLDWFQRRLRHHCEHDLPRGVYYDQRWLDLAATLFDDVHLLRDAGIGVGHWELPERSSGLTGRHWRLVHFSGFDADQYRYVTRYSRRLLRSDLDPATAALFRSYAHELTDCGEAQATSWPYAFGRFDNGVPVPAIARRAYALHPGNSRCYVSPWRSGDSGGFYRWLTAPVDSVQPPIARVWQLVYEQRSDLHQAFPDHRGAHREAFLGWTRSSGRAEYGVDERIG